MTPSADDNAYKRVFLLSVLVDCTNHCMSEDKSEAAFTLRAVVADLTHHCMAASLFPAE
jgi:hypothetical protein